MKTAMKLSKKELLSLYDKSSEVVKKTLRAEFGEAFFHVESPKPIIADSKIVNKNKESKLINWQSIYDFTLILRILAYACLVWFII